MYSHAHYMTYTKKLVQALLMKGKWPNKMLIKEEATRYKEIVRRIAAKLNQFCHVRARLHGSQHARRRLEIRQVVARAEAQT